MTTDDCEEPAQVEEAVRWLTAVGNLLRVKSERYGNSALDPLRVFSVASVIEGLHVRIDDKLSRIVRGRDDDDEDVLVDLVGYLALLAVARRARLRARQKIVQKLSESDTRKAAPK